MPTLSERGTVLATVVAIHVALLALFITHKIVQSALPAETGSIKILPLAPQMASAPLPPPPPALPSRTPDRPRPLTPPAVETDESGAASPAAGCDMLGSIRGALLTDLQALSAVRAAPPETRSIAAAVVIWNGVWSPAAEGIAAPLAPARAAVERTLAEFDEGCLDDLVAGPRFVPIPDERGTIFLVFGSGDWAWRQLATDNTDLPRPDSLANPDILTGWLNQPGLS